VASTGRYQGIHNLLLESRQKFVRPRRVYARPGHFDRRDFDPMSRNLVVKIRIAGKNPIQIFDEIGPNIWVKYDDCVLSFANSQRCTKASVVGWSDVIRNLASIFLAIRAQRSCSPKRSVEMPVRKPVLAPYRSSAIAVLKTAPPQCGINPTSPASFGDGIMSIGASPQHRISRLAFRFADRCQNVRVAKPNPECNANSARTDEYPLLRSSWKVQDFNSVSSIFL